VLIPHPCCVSWTWNLPLGGLAHGEDACFKLYRFLNARRHGSKGTWCYYGRIPQWYIVRRRQVVESTSLTNNANRRVLITTDVWARGIDVQQVSLVINYDLPACVTSSAGRKHSPRLLTSRNRENYIHRIGRSGRFGRKGVAINVLYLDSNAVDFWLTSSPVRDSWWRSYPPWYWCVKFNVSADHHFEMAYRIIEQFYSTQIVRRSFDWWYRISVLILCNRMRCLSMLRSWFRCPVRPFPMIDISLCSCQCGRICCVIRNV